MKPGDRLGPYEILARIGAGGMGEVWKARDTRLDRTVAVKISAEQFTERFEREARAVAALNHPNICTLYDVGPNYLVMEYIDGQPLKGPLPLDRALKYGAQICDALDAAHKQGIVHRDLKPANILVTKSGIKLLDFGLAKRSRDAAVGGATETIALTKANTILGTLQYMAPEQLEGKEADARSDIFSFAAVLYEMVTGKRAFEGKSQASVIAAILERDPPSIIGIAPNGLDRVLRRCLAKGPDDRWQSVRDLKAELEWIAETDPRQAPAVALTRKWRDRILWIITVTAFGVFLFLAGLHWRASSSSDLVRFTVYPPEGTSLSGASNTTVPVPQLAVSPNGRSVILAAAAAGAKPVLWMRSIEDSTARPLAGTEGAVGPFWSSDGRWVGFFAEGKLKKIPAGGGAVQVVAEGIADFRGGTWSRDNTIVFAHGNTGLHRVPAAGGTATVVTKEGVHRWPQFLPDGNHFLFTVRGGEQRGVFAGSLDGKIKKFLVRADTSAHYAPPGYLLWLDGDMLLGQAFDADRLQLSGPRFTVAERVGRSSGGEAAFSVSPSGTLAYGAALWRIGRLTWFDRTGNPLGSVGSEGDHPDFRLSPDEKRLAESSVDPKTNNIDIWLTDLSRGSTVRFTFGPTFNSSPIWSPDGSRLIFRTIRKGVIEFYQKSAGGSGNEEPALTVEAERAAGMQWVNLVPTDWSPDGRHVIFSVPEIASGFDLWLLPVPVSPPGTAKPVSFLGTAADEMHANFSPDGKFVAYSSNESGKFEVYIQTFPRSDRKWSVSTNGGYEPRWRADGREIYYLSADRKLMAVSVGAGPVFGPPKALFQTRVPAGVDAFRTHYVPTRDGQRFLINTQTGDPSPNPITVVLNWTAGLKQ